MRGAQICIHRNIFLRWYLEVHLKRDRSFAVPLRLSATSYVPASVRSYVPTFLRPYVPTPLRSCVPAFLLRSYVLTLRTIELRSSRSLSSGVRSRSVFPSRRNRLVASGSRVSDISPPADPAIGSSRGEVSWAVSENGNQFHFISFRFH